MSEHRRIALCLLALGVGCISGCLPTDDSSATPEKAGETVMRPAEVAKALAELEVIEDPPPLRTWTNAPAIPTKRDLRDSFQLDCPGAFDLLSKTAFEVDSDLLRIAQAEKPFIVRYRAVFILTQRANRAVVPILDRMCSSGDDGERYAAWYAYQKAIEEKRLPPPSNYRTILALYKSEPDEEVHEQITEFLGTAHAKTAVPALLETLRTNPRDYYVIHALGEIGDVAVVPALITAYTKESVTRPALCVALGKLATPQAVDFLIDHLGEDCAVEALTNTKSPKALPALQRHLDKLTLMRQQSGLDFAVTKIAVTKLTFKEPAEPLLVLAEERSNSEWLRHGALAALSDFPAPALHPRILKLFRDDPDQRVKHFCLTLLADSSLKTVTEAFVDWALAFKSPQDFEGCWIQDDLVRALDKRLGCSCQNMRELQDYLNSDPSNPAGDKTDPH